MKACYSCRNPFSSLDELNHLFSSKYTFAKFRKDFFFKLPLQYFRDQIELNYKICHCVLFRVIGIWWHTGLLGQWPLPTYLCKPYFDIWSKFVSCFPFPTKKRKSIMTQAISHVVKIIHIYIFPYFPPSFGTSAYSMVVPMLKFLWQRVFKKNLFKRIETSCRHLYLKRERDSHFSVTFPFVCVVVRYLVCYFVITTFSARLLRSHSIAKGQKVTLWT